LAFFKSIAASSVIGELARFAPVGVISVIIDFITYLALLAVGVSVPVSKAVGFITGSIWSFFGNKHFTFRKNTKGALSLVGFGAIYLLTLFVNIAVNDWLLLHLPRFIPFTVIVAFVFATGVSALLNFLGMKFFIFKGSSL